MDNDSNATIQDLKHLLIEFRDERDWAKFHDPKNLAEAISIEAAELLELFLWKTPEEVAIALKSNSALQSAIEKELADVALVELLTNFTRVTERSVSPQFRRRNIGVMEATIQLLSRTSATLKLLARA